MNKYELAVVVSAKLEDEARADVIEKVKAMITRFGGNVTDVDEWGKRRFAYEIQKMKEEMVEISIALWNLNPIQWIMLLQISRIRMIRMKMI